MAAVFRGILSRPLWSRVGVNNGLSFRNQCVRLCSSKYAIDDDFFGLTDQEKQVCLQNNSVFSSRP